MSQASNFAENKIANLFRGQNITGFTPYLGLFNGNPTDTGTGGTEVTTTVWPDRPAITFGAPSGGVITNTAVVENGLTLGDATVTHYGIFDAASGGNMWTYGAFASQINCVEDEATVIEIGLISIVVA